MESSDKAEAEDSMTAAQRARTERNRLKARLLQESRVIRRGSTRHALPAPAIDSGGGFLLEELCDKATSTVLPPAPLSDPAIQPICEECGRRFPQSFLFDNFDCSVCDECRDDEGEHALMTRTDAKTQFLLKDCDLDSREPRLRCLRRRNPHSARYGDMRLYVSSQVQARAMLVWGSTEALEEERVRREETRAKVRCTRESRKLRALRMDMRSSVYSHVRTEHVHEYGPERHDTLTDEYSRQCISCAHVQIYEKM